jgi:hypothetical protein
LEYPKTSTSGYSGKLEVGSTHNMVYRKKDFYPDDEINYDEIRQEVDFEDFKVIVANNTVN